MRVDHPPWLKIAYREGEVADSVEQLLGQLGLATVCDQAQCPNRSECYSRQTASFLILGSVCTRNCAFCAVQSGRPSAPDPGEPARVARAAQRLGLEFVVITSVTRDDLPDGGAGHFAESIRALRSLKSGRRIEVLVPDFQGNPESLRTVIEARPDVLNHNVETVPRLYDRVRPGADFGRSLDLIRQARQAGATTKSGIMLGLGERIDEVLESLGRLKDAGCQIVTLGQYLRPGDANLEVARYLPPEEFQDLGDKAVQMGFWAVAAGPLVRSSYNAAQLATPSDG